MKKLLLLYTLLISLTGLCQNKTKKQKPVSDLSISIQWQDSLPGEFGFTKKWSYTDGIYINDEGQVRCNGLCPPEIERMTDKDGNIHPDSLRAYYKLIDTTHYIHTIECEASCYEYNGTDYVSCFKNEAGFINCFTMNNVSTHSSLRLTIYEDRCIPTIHLTSIVKGGAKIFKCSEGYITIDRKMLTKGYLKAEFDFKFINPLSDTKTIYWKGKILAPVSEL